MKISIGVQKTLAVLGTLVVAFALFFALERPWFMHWGATQDEQRRVLPLDGFASGAPLHSTRAVTIAAPVDDVWPWLAQLGQEELTVVAVEHADPPRLGQDAGDQVQLAIQRRVTPQQADARVLRAAQALVGLQPADAQHQGWRALVVLQAPFEAGQVEQDQPRVGRQSTRGWQVLEGREGDVVFGTLLRQGLGKGLHPSAVFGGGQQDIGAPGRRGQ